MNQGKPAYNPYEQQTASNPGMGYSNFQNQYGQPNAQQPPPYTEINQHKGPGDYNQQQYSAYNQNYVPPNNQQQFREPPVTTQPTITQIDPKKCKIIN